MLTRPQKYQDGVSLNNFTGTILKIAGIDQLFGNVSTELTEGTVYNVLPGKWAGYSKSIDIFNNTYTKSTTSFKFSNVLGYRKDTDGSDLRISDDLTSTIVNRGAEVYSINNQRAGSLDDCLCVFSGSVQTIGDYDEKFITVGLIDRSILGDTKILTSGNKGNLVKFLGSDAGVPISQKELQIPKVYGDFTKGVTGCAIGYRSNKDVNSPQFIFADHPLKEGGGLFFELGQGVGPAAAKSSTFINFTRTDGITYAYVVLNSPYETVKHWHLRRLDMTKDYNQQLVLHLGGLYNQSDAQMDYIDDNTPEFNELQGVNSQVRVRATHTPGGQGALEGAVAYDVVQSDNGESLDAHFERFRNRNAHIQIVYANYWNAPNDSGFADKRAEWQLLYRKEHQVGRFIKFKMLQNPNTYGTSNTWKWYASQRLVLSSDETGTADAANVKLFTDQLTAWGNQFTPNRPFALASYTRDLPRDLEDNQNAAGTAIEDYVSTMFGAALIEMGWKLNTKVTEDGAASSGLLNTWGTVQGKSYGDWIDSFTAGFDGQTGGTPTEGRLIESGVGIIASLFIDRFDDEVSLEATSKNFDFKSFGRSLYGDVRMRANILDEDMTINKMMTELGKQVPWTGCITPAGQVKFVSLYTPPDIYSPVDEFTYDEMQPGYRIGLTDEKNIVNYLTVKSRWLGERGVFKDETIYENTQSQAQYGIRKKEVEWVNICSEQVNNNSDEDTAG